MQWEGILSWTITRRQVSRDVWLLRPSPVIAHWVSYHQNLLQNWEWAFPATWGKMVMKCPPKYGRIYDHKGAVSTTNGTYQEHCQWLNNKGICHLHLQRLNPMLLYLLTFNNPWGSSGWSEALCAPGNLVGQVFRELDVFSNRFYDLNPCISSYLEKH